MARSRSQAHFKTAKSRPSYPEGFGSLEDAQAHFVPFFDGYHDVHHHSALGWMTRPTCILAALWSCASDARRGRLDCDQQGTSMRLGRSLSAAPGAALAQRRVLIASVAH